MITIILRIRILIVAAGCLYGLTAIAQDDCSAEMAEIDRRIATGNHSEQNVQISAVDQAISS